mgnify:FL=1
MIRAGTISAGTINAGTINSGTINAGTINSGTINVGTINSGTINAGTINAGTFTMGIGTLTAGTLNAGTVTMGIGTLNSGTINVATVNAATINAGTIGTVSNLGTMMTLLAGEDQTNDVLKTEQQFSYYNHVGTAGSTSGTVKAAAGFLHAIIYNTHTSGGTYTLYDSSGTSATRIGIVAPGAALAPFTSIYDVKFTTALTVVSGSACDLTFAYR